MWAAEHCWPTGWLQTSQRAGRGSDSRQPGCLLPCGLLGLKHTCRCPPGCRSKERFDEIEGKITPFLRGCGYNPKKDLIFIPISGAPQLGGCCLEGRLG